jgi:2-oxoglutarate ferredoxin oxidoreductase subunit alpha
MNITWKYQIPAFILADKTLSEGTYSVDTAAIPEIQKGDPSIWSGTQPYHRYSDTPTGISPLAFPGLSDAVIKVNSYAHDESGITIEDADHVRQMTKKRMRKEEGLTKEMQEYSCVNISGNPDASTALLCWGSPKGICNEIAAILGLRVIQPIVLSPFPLLQLQHAVGGVQRLIAVEENSTGQFAALAKRHGIVPEEQILWYDGRPLSPDYLIEKISEMVI